MIIYKPIFQRKSYEVQLVERYIYARVPDVLSELREVDNGLCICRWED